MRKKGQVQEVIERNNALLNVITPMGISFEKNSLSIGENYGKVYGMDSQKKILENTDNYGRTYFLLTKD